MKKLKLQKALLAICLALPITLTTNQAISATETNIEIIENKADDNGNNANQTQQEQLELIANKETHKEALQYYIDIKKNPNLGEAEYKQFLQYYIKNNIGKYLALIIQAKNNLIQFPETQNIKQSITSDAIYRMLINNEPNTPNPIYSQSKSTQQLIIQHIQIYFSKLEKEQQDELTAVAKILKELFTLAVTETTSYIMKPFKALKSYFLGGNENSTNNLTELIDTYINQKEQGQEPTEEAETLNKFILRYTDDTVQQLHKEVAAFDEKHGEEKRKLNDIVNQIEKFFKANKTKQAAKEEEKKESELDKSNLSSKSQKTDDIIVADIKEENKEEEQKSNTDEAENKEEIINNSKKEEIEVKKEEEEEKETHSKRSNPILNTSLSAISEEKKEENDEKNKEDVKTTNAKQKDTEIKAEQEETNKELKDTQTENKTSDDNAIEEIKQLINEWQQKKEEINKDKEEKLTQLEKDIKELEQKYKQIVKGDEEDEESMR